MTDRIDDTPFNARTGRNHELSVGAGASIVIVVAATLALMVTLLFASLTPTRAAEITPAVGDPWTIDYDTVVMTAGAVSRTSTYALTNATTPYAVRIASLGYAECARRDPGFAKGINMVDGTDFHYAIAAADYQLYGTDFGLNRNVFHHGVGLGTGGLATYRDTIGNNFNWKTKYKAKT